jgi:predicted hydrocarbon binding protein
MFPKMKAAGSLPDQLHTPEEFLRFEAEQFLDNYRGDGAMPRKFIKVDPGHIVIEAASPGYHCSFTEGVYSGILRLCDITNGRVRQTKCVLDGDANCEYDIRW